MIAPASIRFWTGGAVALAGGYSQYQARFPLDVRRPLISAVLVSPCSMIKAHAMPRSLHTVDVFDTNSYTSQRLLGRLGEVEARRHGDGMLLAYSTGGQDRV